jgi:ABC-type dipeptide/oligopeptide/nickel transport system ATPase component
MTSLLRVQDLVVEVPAPGGGIQRAVDGLSLDLAPGETLAIVGESGSGKSLSALAIMRLLPRPAVRMAGGRIELEGRDLGSLSDREMTTVRGRSIGMIFQEPMTALNPVYTIGDQLGETLRLHRSMNREEARRETIQLLDRVAIPGAAERLKSYPHELSGGMRQRVLTAIAIASRPRLLIADEPTTALDVRTQRGVLDLLGSISAEDGMGMLLITHDITLVGERADRVCVLCQGRTCEIGPVEQVLSDPLHPYTRGLVGCTPRLDAPRGQLPMLEELVPDPASERLSTPRGLLRPWWPGMPGNEAYRLLEAADGRLVGVIDA